MVNGTIGVDVAALEGMAGKVKENADHFRSELGNLQRLVEETKTYMQGGPQTAFEEKYQQFKGSMTNFIGALEVYSEAMRKYAEDAGAAATIGTQRFDSI